MSAGSLPRAMDATAAPARSSPSVLALSSSGEAHATYVALNGAERMHADTEVLRSSPAWTPSDAHTEILRQQMSRKPQAPLGSVSVRTQGVNDNIEVGHSLAKGRLPGVDDPLGTNCSSLVDVAGRHCRDASSPGSEQLHRKRRGAPVDAAEDDYLLSLHGISVVNAGGLERTIHEQGEHGQRRSVRVRHLLRLANGHCLVQR
mmetsp:Transcript_1458/g.4372  ORF Transcript_1458/g.4372 Transcript_1458/m.4372 type:complete len:203 (+) Transcript_1458:2955-3563(+)